MLKISPITEPCSELLKLLYQFHVTGRELLRPNRMEVERLLEDRGLVTKTDDGRMQFADADLATGYDELDRHIPASNSPQMFRICPIPFHLLIAEFCGIPPTPDSGFAIMQPDRYEHHLSAIALCEALGLVTRNLLPSGELIRQLIVTWNGAFVPMHQWPWAASCEYFSHDGGVVEMRVHRMGGRFVYVGSDARGARFHVLIPRGTLENVGLQLTAAGMSAANELRSTPQNQNATTETTHSEDFTTISWFGTNYSFTPGQQAETIRHLWAEYERGELGISEKTIGEKIGSSSDRYRLAHTFRNHPAWETIIRKVTSGVFKLVNPKNHQ